MHKDVVETLCSLNPRRVARCSIRLSKTSVTNLASPALTVRLLDAADRKNLIVDARRCYGEAMFLEIVPCRAVFHLA